MVEYVQHFTTTTPDAEGRYLVGSDQVVDVCYYDASSESWTLDYSNLVNPFTNADFSNTTITGAGPNQPGNYWYETGSDATAFAKVWKFQKLPYDESDEVIAKYGTLIANTATQGSTTAAAVTGSYYSDSTLQPATPPRNIFPQHYSNNMANRPYWTTTSGKAASGGGGLIAWSLNQTVPIAGFYFDSLTYNDTSIPSGGTAESRLAAISSYQIQVATSGTGLTNAEYVTVASGTKTSNSPHGIWVDIPPTNAKFVRLLFRNAGSTSRTTLGKFFAYTQDTIDRGMSLFASRVQEGSTTTTLALNQVVDLTGINNVYLDVREHANNLLDIFRIQVNGVTKTPISASNSVSNDVMSCEIKGLSIDTTSAGFGSVFTILRRVLSQSGQAPSAMQIANVRVQPSWFTEAPSSKRGSTAAYPEKTIIVSDARGLSIIDADTMLLWMRFDIGVRKMLQERPIKVVGHNGKIYLGCTRGLYIIDFTNDRITRYDSRGPRDRYGIEYRNVNGLDTEEWSENSIGFADWMCHEYMRETDTPVLPSYGINDLAVGTDATFGTYIIMATDEGLVTYNGLRGASGLTYSSLDDRPVYKVKVVNGAVWYLQGEGHEQQLNYIPTITSAATVGFIPSRKFYKSVDIAYDLAGEIDTDAWEIIDQDPGMSLLEGDVLVVSGTHTRSGATGIILKDILPNRSFSAKVKVKVKEFPSNARGAVRFGICRDYHPVGPLSLESNLGASNRTGFFISAFNNDPFGWPLLESNTFTQSTLGSDRNWFYTAISSHSASSTETNKFARATVSGIEFLNYNGRGTGSAVDSEDINKITTIPVVGRDFTARVQVQLYSGFSASVAAGTNANPNAFFGITRHGEFTPGGSTDGNYVDAAMVATGNTTFSGVLVYTTGAYASSNFITNVSLVQPRQPVASGVESTGIDTTPYRTWRLDYTHNNNAISCYIDDILVAPTVTGTSYLNPHRIGLAFGVGSHGSSANQAINRFVKVRNLSVDYPALISGSRYKYGVELSNPLTGDLQQVPKFYPTYSGIARVSDLTPVSGTLTTVTSLSDGNTLTGSTAVSLNNSIGIALDSAHPVEALYLYDTVSGTSGWNSALTTKRLDVRYSNDNQNWTFVKRYHMLASERINGVSKIRFCPAVDAKFFKFTAIDATGNYNISGNTPWTLSEIRAATVSGIDFFPTDRTDDAEFHEWRLDWDRDTSKVTGLIDGAVVATGSLSYSSLKGCRLMLLHDLTPVSSGIDSDFVGEFKDLQITYSGTQSMATGTVNAIDISFNQLDSGNPNYTIASASTMEALVADVDFGPSPVSDLVRSFPQADIFGDSEFTSTLISETAAYRDNGLILVGNSTYLPAYYRKRIKRSPWYENYSTAVNDYGSSFAWAYHPGEDSVFIIHHSSSCYGVMANLDTGLCRQVSFVGLKDVFLGTTNDDVMLVRDAPKIVYNNYHDRMTLIATNGRVASVDVRDGAATRPDTATLVNDNSTVDGGRYMVAYVLHSHKIFCAQNYFAVIDAATDIVDANPLRFATLGRWGRDAGTVPWSSTSSAGDDNGWSYAAYCEYDKATYVIGKHASSYASTQYFGRFHTDKNYMEILGSYNQQDDVWPPSDATWLGNVPVYGNANKALSMVYDPRRRRMYVLFARSNTSHSVYYDVVNNVWVDEGLSPAMDSYRDVATSSLANTNFSVYDIRHDRILSSNGDGINDPYIYEYYGDRDTLDAGFDYKPSRDGLPTMSGIAKHFTTSQGIITDRTDSASGWERDFYYQAAVAGQKYVYHHGSEFITISGITTPLASTPGAAANDVYELYVSADSLDPRSSFDISANVALPTFNRTVFVSTGASRNAQAYFVMGISDGVNRPWAVTSTYGTEDPALYQSVEFRAGVSGTVNNTTTAHPFVAHVKYVDGYNSNNDGVTPRTRPIGAYDSYLNGGVNLVSEFSNFKNFRLSYDYETDIVTGYVDGVTCGSTTLRRKFNDNGVRFHIGFTSNSDLDTTHTPGWLARVKDIKFTPKAWDRIERGRLVTSISGAIGTYKHERFDSTLISGTNWVYSADMYFPTSRKYTGFDYIATVGGMADGHRLAELVIFSDPQDQSKWIGITGNEDTRHDSTTYLATAPHVWDDSANSLYKMVKDLSSGTVKVYLGTSETPVMEVPYGNLPQTHNQQMYYGKVNYGTWEKIYESPTLVGSWTSNPNYTGNPDDDVGKMAFNSTAHFATMAQGVAATATFTLDADLGSVDVYVFHHATGFDGAKNAPFTITHEGLVSLPPTSGEGTNIFSIANDTDELGAPAINKTTLRVDQRRVKDGSARPANGTTSQGSGWIYLGTYINPTSVVLTANASVGGASTQGFVCADAIAVNLGKYGKSTFDMKVARIRYKTDATEFPPVPYEPSGLTIIDLESSTIIDTYGEHTGPAFEDSDITVGIRRE